MWIEKYRPKTFDEYIFNNNDEIKYLEECIKKDPFTLPNIILVASPGTGKTTLAKVITSTLNSEMLYLNASDERGIDVMRQRVKEFVRAVAFNPSVPKIVHFDEADGLTKDAQDLLRNLTEESSLTCRFIFTCNNANKIIKPLKDRCELFELSNPDKDKIFKRLKYITAEEHCEYTDEFLNDIIEKCYPSIRAMVKSLQSGRISVENDITEELFKALQNKDDKTALKLAYDRTLNHRQIVINLVKMYVKVGDISKIELFAECDFRLALNSTPEIQLVWLVKELLK